MSQPNPSPAVIVRPALLLPQNIVVADECDRVSVTVGNATLTLDYTGALRLSQMLRVHAKRAKRFAGDTGRHWSAVGVLDGEPA